MISRIVMLALMGMGASGLAVAQAQTPPAENTSPPSSSQRAPAEAPTTGSSTSNPASASSPHQRQAMAKGGTDKMMKDCIAKERAQNSGMSQKDAKSACKAQMKSSPQPENR